MIELKAWELICIIGGTMLLSSGLSGFITAIIIGGNLDRKDGQD